MMMRGCDVAALITVSREIYLPEFSVPREGLIGVYFWVVPV
jgi:hypothetical protein